MYPTQDLIFLGILFILSVPSTLFRLISNPSILFRFIRNSGRRRYDKQFRAQWCGPYSEVYCGHLNTSANNSPPVPLPLSTGETIKNGKNVSKGVKTLSHQAYSPFFRKLPVEIREMIFKLVLGNTRLRITTESIWIYDDNDLDKLGGGGRKRFYMIKYPTERWYHKLARGKAKNYYHDSRILLALPLTCQRMYLECIPILYKDNQFEIDPAQLYWIPSLLPQYHLRSLRTLKLDEWSMSRDMPACAPCMEFFFKAWDKLLTFTGLRRLSIGLSGPFQETYRNDNSLRYQWQEYGSDWLVFRARDLQDTLNLATFEIMLPLELRWMVPLLMPFTTTCKFRANVSEYTTFAHRGEDLTYCVMT